MAIPFSRHILSNGLTLLIHEDHSTPLVAYHMIYKVGSKNEDPSLTGLAHLLEHSMFDGSVNVLILMSIFKTSEQLAMPTQRKI